MRTSIMPKFGRDPRLPPSTTKFFIRRGREVATACVMVKDWDELEAIRGALREAFESLRGKSDEEVTVKTAAEVAAEEEGR